MLYTLVISTYTCNVPLWTMCSFLTSLLLMQLMCFGIYYTETYEGYLKLRTSCWRWPVKPIETLDVMLPYTNKLDMTWLLLLYIESHWCFLSMKCAKQIKVDLMWFPDPVIDLLFCNLWKLHQRSCSWSTFCNSVISRRHSGSHLTASETWIWFPVFEVFACWTFLLLRRGYKNMAVNWKI